MRFVETPIFTKVITRLLDDDAYRALQAARMLRPEQGPTIGGTHGARKLRWVRSGAGKRGGLRVIYYWAPTDAAFYDALRVCQEHAGRPDASAGTCCGSAHSGGVPVKDEAFRELVASVRQAGRIRRGTLRASRTTTFRPADVKAVRGKLGTSQSEFALMIGVSVATLRNWEQGRRTPDGPALALLRVAAKNPQAVAEALHGRRGAA